MIKLVHNIQKTINDLKRVKNHQVPYATSLAINRTAQKVKLKQEHEIRDVFDRPTPFIQNSIFIKPSTKETLTATVGIKDFAFGKGIPAVKPLMAEVAGGERKLKRFERALRAIGAIPSNYFLVPGEKAPLDIYGNVPGGCIVKLLSYFRAFPEDGYRSNSTEASRKKIKKGTKKTAGASYYVGYAGKGSQLGIWRRNHAGALFTGPVKPIEPMFILVQSANYESIYEFKYVAELAINKEFSKEFERAWQKTSGTFKNSIQGLAIAAAYSNLSGSVLSSDGSTFRVTVK